MDTLMNETTFYYIVYAWIAIGILVFPFNLRIAAPYGRHISRKWGLLIDNRLGWILMESPALLVFAGFFLFGSLQHNTVTWVLFLLWVAHYVNRTLIFPFRLRTKGKKMPVAIVLMALGFNFMNGFLNGYYLGSLATGYTNAWFEDPRFVIGTLLFFFGMAVNQYSDNILIHLRRPGETGYVIPTGGLFRYISCPNHFGELVEWTGYAILSWSSPALAFAVWSFANLVPRAVQHHKWYQEQFEDYPKERKAVIPILF